MADTVFSVINIYVKFMLRLQIERKKRFQCLEIGMYSVRVKNVKKE